jgi:hypothetical protein
LNGKLRSMAAEFDWEPNGIPLWHKWTASNKTKIDWPPVPYQSPNGVDEEMAGFHAFKSVRDVEFEYRPCDADDAVVGRSNRKRSFLRTYAVEPGDGMKCPP